MTTSAVASELDLPKSSVKEILVRDLELRNVFSEWVPQNLTTSLKQQRVECCKALVELFNNHGLEFLGFNLLVQDESCIFWDQEESRQVWIEKRAVKPTTHVRS